jgi:2-phospho-L-lactate guanylyltransferase
LSNASFSGRVFMRTTSHQGNKGHEAAVGRLSYGIENSDLQSASQDLRGVLRSHERRAFNEMLLTRVLDAIKNSGGLSRCIVVSEDRDALKLANQFRGYPSGRGPQPGLNAALGAACDAARTRRATSILILAADLPDASRGALARLRGETLRGSAAIIADKMGCGTNGLLLPADCDAKFGFGHDSLRRHCAAIKSTGLPVVIWNDPVLAFDIDSPADFLRWSLASLPPA